MDKIGFTFTGAHNEAFTGRLSQVSGIGNTTFHVERYWRGKLNKEEGWYYDGILHKTLQGWELDTFSFSPWKDEILQMAIDAGWVEV